jgi:4-hydroxy-3-polyprenylbenzoate decarboxylase
MSFSKVICVLDEDIDVQDLGQVAWRLLANLDPKRDFAFVDGPIDQLDHGASQALWGSKVCIDGTRKWREEGYAREWPEPCRMSAQVEARVDAIWAELGIDEATPGGARDGLKAPAVAGDANGSSANGARPARVVANGASAADVFRNGAPAAHLGRTPRSVAEEAVARVLEVARVFLSRGRP